MRHLRPETTLFYDVDTQRDFMLPGGALYVPNAERILSTLALLTRLARDLRIRIVASVDRHFPPDAELRRNGGEFPDHCMDATEGQRKVSQTAPQNPFFIENHALTEDQLRRALLHRGELIIEKQAFDAFVGNCNTTRLLSTLAKDYSDVVVYGVCTDICVDQAVRGLLRLGPKITVVTDAIAELDADRGREVRDEWREGGADLIDYSTISARLGRDSAQPRKAPGEQRNRFLKFSVRR